MNPGSSIGTGEHADWLAMAARTAHVALGISRFDSGEFVEANDAFCRLFQRSRGEILGRTSAELGMWPDATQRARLVDMLRRQGSVGRFEARYRNSRGETGDVEVSARIVTQGGQSFMVGFLTEVTDRREFLEGLRTAQARLGVVLRASSILVFRQDAQLRYTWVANPALGASESELIGRTDDEVMGAEAAAPLVRIKRRVLESGRAERQDVWVAHNGQLGCFDLVVEPDCDAAGRVLGIVCAAQDITARMTAGRAAARMPAIAIVGLAALLGREARSPRQAERLRRIDEQAGPLAGGAAPATALDRIRDRHAGACVVVAEHNAVLAELLGALLQDAGLRVTPARTGVEAFSFTLQLVPALLLLDMDMPQNGGVAAARAVRAMLPQRVPIVAMLSAALPADAATALDADLDDVLDKPVAAADLYDKVLSWLEAR